MLRAIKKTRIYEDVVSQIHELIKETSFPLKGSWQRPLRLAVLPCARPSVP